MITKPKRCGHPKASVVPGKIRVGAPDGLEYLTITNWCSECGAIRWWDYIDDTWGAWKRPKGPQ